MCFTIAPVYPFNMSAGLKRCYRAGAIGWTGCGGYGHGLHHGVVEAEGIDLVAIADPIAEGRRKVAAECGVENTYADFREMLDRESLDLVTVGPRWVSSRVEIVTACAEAGCHIYCEKPFAATPHDADLMLSVAEARGVKLAVAHQGVFLPQAAVLKDMVAGGEIGRVHSVVARGKQDHRGGGEDMMVLGTHLFNMLGFLFGNASAVYAQVRSGGAPITREDVRQASEPIGPIAGDDVVSFTTFESGVVALFESRRDQPGKGASFGFEITGDAGRIVVHGTVVAQIKVYPNTGWATRDFREPIRELNAPAETIHLGNRYAIEELMTAVEQDRKPRGSAADALAALEIILGAYESQITGRRISLPLKDRAHPLENWIR